MRDFIEIKDKRIGLIVLNDAQPGQLRGHYIIWFGDIDGDGMPIIEQHIISNEWKEFKVDGIKREVSRK